MSVGAKVRTFARGAAWGWGAKVLPTPRRLRVTREPH